MKISLLLFNVKNFFQFELQIKPNTFLLTVQNAKYCIDEQILLPKYLLCG